MFGIESMWPLGLLLLIPLIILFYILKQEAKPVTVSSVMHWAALKKNTEARKPWEKLKTQLLMLLQILMIVLIAAALMGPWIRGTKSSQALVMVIDNSAGMSALYEGEKTRLDAAKEQAINLVDRADPGTQIYVAVCSGEASLICSGTTDARLAKNRIESITQTLKAGNLSDAAGLIGSVISGLGQAMPEEGRDGAADGGSPVPVYYLTDEPVSETAGQPVVISFAGTAENGAAENLCFTEDEDTLTLLVDAVNYGEADYTRDMTLYTISSDGSEKVAAVSSVTALAGGRSAVYFKLKTTDLKDVCGFKALLSGKDALEGDNETYCAYESRGESRVLIVSKQNVYLEKAFAGIGGLDVYRADDLSVLLQDEAYDLYVFDGMVPEVLPEKGSILIFNGDLPGEKSVTKIDAQAAKENSEGNGSEEDGSEEGGALKGSWLTFSDTPLTTWVGGLSIGVTKTMTYKLPVWGNPFILCEDQCCGYYGLSGARKMALIGFDLHDTDFALRTEYPVLMTALYDYLLGGSFLDMDSFTPGESLAISVSDSGGEIQITGTKQFEQVLSNQEQGCYFVTEEPGLYRITQTVENEVQAQSFAVCFPAEESLLKTVDITAAASEGTATDQDTGKVLGGIALRRGILVLALMLLALEWLVYIRSTIRRDRSRRSGEMLLRALVALCLVLAIFEPHLPAGKSRTTTIFLVDQSDSMKSLWQSESDLVREAIQKMGPGDEAGVVAFGGDTKVAQPVTDQKLFNGVGVSVTGSATDLQSAVQTAMAMFPEENGRRLVILTDGSENEGDVTRTISALTGSGVEVKTQTVKPELEGEVYVSSVTMPETISEGEQFNIEVEVYAADAGEATITLYSGETKKSGRLVQLIKGMNRLVFSDQGLESGIRRYRVTVEADSDVVTVNNTYSAFTQVTAPAKVLLVEGKRGSGEAFEQVLKAGSFKYDIITAGGTPTKVSDLLTYQSVILLDVHGDDLKSGAMEALKQYVEDYGGGLIAIGGDNSFALGHYQNTALEEVLPVQMDLTGEKQVPSIGMVMVIDHSGSMDSPSTDKGGYSCMDIAKMAALNGLESLRTIDEVGVLAFSDTYAWAAPLQKAVDRESVEMAIEGIPPGGGTSIYPALAEAARALGQSDAAIKHIILLTDGQDGYYGYDQLLPDLKDEGITLSCVAVGSGCDADLLSYLAKEGGGRYYYSDAGTALPRIFAQEVYLSTKSYLRNEPFVPKLTASHEVISGLFTEGMPEIGGYIATSPKAHATVVLTSQEDDPILALWQYGLGRSAAWLSDGTGRWSGALASCQDYPELWKNLIDWSMAGMKGGDDYLSLNQTADGIHLNYETADYDAGTGVSAVLTGEEGLQQEVTLKATSPGRYEADVSLSETGVYSVNVRHAQGGEIVSALSSMAAMQYSREYRFASISSGFEVFKQRTGAREITGPDEVFDTELKGTGTQKDLTSFFLILAAILFMIDVAARRLYINWFGWIVGKVRSIKKAGPVLKPVMSVQTVHKTAKETDQEMTRKSDQKSKKKDPRKDAPQGIDTAALLKKKKDRER